MVQHITEANFEGLLAQDKPVILDFWAEWCGPCRMITPVIEELAQLYDDKVIVGKVSVDENDALTERFAIRNVPTVLFLRGGVVVDKIVGAATKDAFIQKIDALL
ncbi:MAG: thioredoxin [Tannerellaceae bacterium]|jgi:thioredoxin 1|nr:thioredoxin [Tannerellaceae bacterium]